MDAGSVLQIINCQDISMINSVRTWLMEDKVYLIKKRVR